MKPVHILIWYYGTFECWYVLTLYCNDDFICEVFAECPLKVYKCECCIILFCKCLLHKLYWKFSVKQKKKEEKR